MRDVAPTSCSLRSRSAIEAERSLSAQEMADILWRLASPEMFSLITEVEGYSTNRFGDWLAAMLKATLLQP